VEPPRHLRLADEIQLQELVDGVHRRCLGYRRRSRGQLGLEWVASHRCAFEHQASWLREQRELLGQRSGDRGRYIDGLGQLGRAGTSRRCEIPHPRELLEVERVAAALLVQRRRLGGIDCLTEKSTHLGGTQCPKLNAGQHPAAMCPVDNR
jgi:hypothetical protein